MNIHVTANYRVKDMFNKHKSFTEDYDEMAEICVKSFKTNLKQLDKTIILTGDVRDYNEMFKNIFYTLYEMKNDGNILFTDIDTICIEETEIFNKFKHFDMFGEPHNIFCSYPPEVDKKIYEDLIPWFMANVRYFPKDLDNSIWKEAKKLADNWINVWAYECIIYNRMYKLQKENNGNNPSLNVLWFNKTIIPKNSKIIHVCGSRGTKDALKKMKELSKEWVN